jgi:hypothetical protein
MVAPDVASAMVVPPISRLGWHHLLLCCPGWDPPWQVYGEEVHAELHADAHGDACAGASADDAGSTAHSTSTSLLPLAPRYECVLRPSEILFVPAGCPHAVKNLTHTSAISANFVDVSNLDQVRDELRIAGLRNPDAARLYRHMSSADFLAAARGSSGETSTGVGTAPPANSAPCPADCGRLRGGTDLAWPDFKTPRRGPPAPPPRDELSCVVGSN